jgi:hypothetical protein
MSDFLPEVKSSLNQIMSKLNAVKNYEPPGQEVMRVQQNMVCNQGQGIAVPMQIVNVQMDTGLVNQALELVESLANLFDSVDLGVQMLDILVNHLYENKIPLTLAIGKLKDQYASKALAASHGNKAEAARTVGMNRTTFHEMLRARDQRSLEEQNAIEVYAE